VCSDKGVRLRISNTAKDPLEKDDKTLKEVGITSQWATGAKSKQNMLLASDMSGNEAGFIDLRSRKNLQHRKWSNSAPDWRYATNGVNIEGKCPNDKCPAFGKLVICKWG